MAQFDACTYILGSGYRVMARLYLQSAGLPQPQESVRIATINFVKFELP